jgi:lysine biosynthesis protein LysW
MLDERPITACPECTGEIDLTFATEGDTITCSVCGAECIVLALDPPEVELVSED